MSTNAPLRQPWPQPRARIRCSDADRTRVVEQLQVHYVEGRLRLAEYQQRTEAALAATYLDDLPWLLVELPAVPARKLPSARAHRHFCRDRMLLFGVLAVVVAAVVAVLVGVADGAAQVLLLTALPLPVTVVFALVLGLPCPRHRR